MRTYRRQQSRDPDRRMAVAVRLRAEGLSLRQIAARLACSYETIRHDLAAWDENGEVRMLGPTLDKTISDSHVGRARRARVPSEYISLAAVAERDQWRCGICGKPVLRTWNHDDRKLMPSLDHVVPLEHGGSHLYSNVQLAHFFCNLSKGSGKREPHRVQSLTLAAFTAAARKVLAGDKTVADALGEIGGQDEGTTGGAP